MNIVYTSSSLCSRQMIKPFRAHFQKIIIIQRYSSNNGGGESTNKPIGGHEHQERLPRAPSTAEQFERVAQEKAKHGHGLASQTVDKAQDAIEEATTINQTYKEPVGKGNSQKTEDV